MARSFNGSSDLITLPTVFEAVKPVVSISCLVNVTNVGATRAIIGSSNAGSGALYFKINSTSATLALDKQGVANEGNSSGAVSTGTWTHVGMTWNNTSFALQFYIKGALDSSFTGSAALTTGLRYEIGNSAQAEPFLGSIAHLAIWSARLSPSEFQSLATGTRPSAVRPNSIYGYWPLDGYGHPALDLSPYKNTGVLTGTALVGPGHPLISSGPPILPTNVKNTTVAASAVVFRKTLSSIGTRTGSRQMEVSR